MPDTDGHTYRDEPLLYYGIALAGITAVVKASYATMVPRPTAVAAAVAMSAAFLMLIYIVMPKSENVRCRLLGHAWTIDPPWAGKELRYDPHCERCGHEPEDVVITGSVDE